jgi:hypothetical protein
MPSDPDSLAGDLIRAVEILGEVFEARGVRYALLGGLATMLRGRPRFTQDIDILLDVPQIALPGLLEELIARGFSMDRDTVIREVMLLRQPSRQFATVEQIGGTTVYLCSPAADQVTGTTISVDGGWTAL